GFLTKRTALPGEASIPGEASLHPIAVTSLAVWAVRARRLGHRPRRGTRSARGVARDERLRQETPAVDGDEQEELERQAHLRRIEHLHAEREQDVGDDEVDDQKR